MRQNVVRIILLIIVLVLASFLFGRSRFGLLLLIILFIAGAICIVTRKNDTKSWLGENTLGNLLGSIQQRLEQGSLRKFLKRLMVLSFIGAIIFTIAILVGADYYKKHNTENTIQDLKKSIEKYKTEKLEYPKTLESIVNNDPLKRGLLEDRWGKKFIYNSTGKTYTLYSCGPDGVSGTGDDIK